MSGTLSSVTMFACLVAIAVAANWAEDDTARPRRGPSSVAMPLRHTEKLRGSLRAELHLVGQAPSHAGDVFVVRGVVRSEKTLANISFTWSLPEGVEVLEGDLRGKLARVGPDEPGQLELKLRRGDAGESTVHLVVGASEGGRRFADAGQLDWSNDSAAVPASRRTRDRALRPGTNSKKFE